MIVKEKKFDEDFLKSSFEMKKKCIRKFDDLTIVNNIFLIFKKLLENRDSDGTYVECGVFRGGTLIPSVTFAKENDIDFNFIGVDTFNGFPSKSKSKYDVNDLPSKFVDLYETGLISKNHFDNAKIRTDNFNDTNHLKSEYFNNDFNDLFDFCDSHKNVSLLKNKFKIALNDFNENINILHIDCDLYESYLECLNFLYKRVVSGGSIIFDEYYSHKYPGARIAVNEFFEDKNGYFEKYTTPESFERWCFVKG